MVRVVDVRKYELKPGEVLIRIGRDTPVGNPFIMHAEAERIRVCEQYEDYFAQNIVEGVNPAFRDYIVNIYKTALKKDVALGCFCAPRRCHGETIARFINSKI